MTTALIITAAGINCDHELGEAFAAAGAGVVRHHLNDLMADPTLVDRFDLIGIPGGFSYGDAIAAGRVAAQLMRHTLYPAFVRAIERGVPIMAPCNGFQIAVQIGLLPGPDDGVAAGVEPAPPSVTLAMNESACFVDRWVRVNVPENTRCIWTRGLDLEPETSMLPIAHGEGRFVPDSEATLARLHADGRVALRYAPSDNPNGSIGDVAGICDRSGLVLGLMPHPERYTRWTQHPWWTRLTPAERSGDPPGLQMFKNAVTHAAQCVVS